MKLMDRFTTFMSEKVNPVLQKIAANTYISGLQSAILKTVPMVFVSSIITVYNVVRKFVDGLPDLGGISTYTFGLISLFMSFLVAYYILEKKNNTKAKFVGGLTSLALFLMMTNPTITEDGLYAFNINNFGAGGMFVAIVAGIFTAIIFTLCRKIQIFSEDSAIPDFCREWFDTMLPIFLVVFIGWLLVIQLHFDLYTTIVNIFMPLVDISNTYIGVLLLYMVPTILYSMGISGWVFQPILNPVSTMALAANIAAMEAGTKLPYIFCGGFTTAYLSLGGRGVTFMLVVLFCISKSKRLRTLGKAYFVPNLLNINEPVVFGSIAWNPTLMVPMWLSSFAVVTISYFASAIGLVPIAYEAFSLWYIPVGITAFLVSKSISGVILCLVNLAVSTIIWYPFFKAYEKQVIEEDTQEEQEKTEEVLA